MLTLLRSVHIFSMFGEIMSSLLWLQKTTPKEEAKEETDSLEEESDKARFTLQELRDVLQERNELKAQVFMMQEELAYYKRLIVWLVKSKIVICVIYVVLNTLKTNSFPLVFRSEEEFDDDVCPVVCAPSPPPCPSPAERPESGIRRLWVIIPENPLVFKANLT